MSTLLIKKADGSDLPRGTRVRIVTYPMGLRTYKGVVSRSAMVELDPGAYSVVIHKSTKNQRGKFDLWKEVSVVYHDITKEQLQKLEGRTPKHITAIVTTHGNRWRCNYPGCDVTDLTSVIAGQVHELEDHYNERPLDDEPEKKVTAPPAEKKIKPQRRRQGRPRTKDGPAKG